MMESRRGFPDFWKAMHWTWNDGIVNGKMAVRVLTMTEDISTETPLVLLERILQGWKEMVAENDNETATPPSSHASSPSLSNKKRNITETRDKDQGYDIWNGIVTCGRARNVSTHQHRLDMRLLHSSPTWRSFYHSLREREVIVR
jgi:hypothetical protein